MRSKCIQKPFETVRDYVKNYVKWACFVGSPLISLNLKNWLLMTFSVTNMNWIASAGKKWFWNHHHSVPNHHSWDFNVSICPIQWAIECLNGCSPFVWAVLRLLWSWAPMSTHTLESRAHSCDSLKTGVGAAVAISQMQLKTLNKSTIQKRLEAMWFHFYKVFLHANDVLYIVCVSINPL